MDKQIQYLQTCLPAAEKAGGTYDMNPVVILAQGALESGWGTSHLAREHHNYFGIMGYGASNGYWHGERAKVEGTGGVHYFRHYAGVEFSFLDFARLIRTGYHRAWSFSRQPEAYAKEIAYSPYISEQNGDNRELYRRNLIAIAEKIITLKDMYDWMRGRAK
ncbi:glucosaminidase [Parabacteroides goldsteinii]|uniref:Glucosaminidase n=1 Tax=Parabacteroides goldsteinii TaxID=328812 RepID=A0A0J6CEU1_9BACT|nr:glucosaminidase domain-containing protein [Parabacteroides goldsteinii]KMM30629.1 glucosaminidase [Parabacteroides goldsteinii]